MNAVTIIKKWGNSDAVRIPSSIIKTLDLKENQQLNITIEDGKIVFTPIKTNDEPTTLKELFANWQDDGVRDHELDWGESKGNELEW